MPPLLRELSSKYAMNAQAGLTRQRAAELRARYGSNAIPPERYSPLTALAHRLWGPIPWVLEVTLALTVLTRRYGDSVAIAFLLLFNAVVAAAQEGKARDAVDLLRKKVVVQTRVKRDGSWETLPADQIVPGDLVHLGGGDIVPADLNVLSGSAQVDESVLTGESMPRTAKPEEPVYAGTTVVRADATAVVTKIGTSTKFGKTAELVRIAHSPGQLEHIILRIVTGLTAVSAVVIVLIAVFAARFGMTAVDIAVFAVMILLASVPIALPAAFTLATTIGSLDMTEKGALVTRLSALEDAASMDVLCTDKTGTITENRLAIEDVVALEPFSPLQITALAAAASDQAGREPVDLLVLDYARAAQAPALTRTSFTPFDPLEKWSAAGIAWNGAPAMVYKGAPDALRAMAQAVPERFDAEVRRLAGAGARVIAVAISQSEQTRIAGLIALADPPRGDAAAIVRDLHESGVEVMLLTGDGAPTALNVARRVGIPADHVHASIYPEDKLAIIGRLQKAGHVVGMTGDGVNDAPALRQADIGIAVSTAADVAKAAAGIVLTGAGLKNIIAAVQSSRAVFERMVTYTMLKLVKYFEIVGVLTVGFFATRTFLLTPELMVCLLVFNDLVTLSISGDHVRVSHTLRVWKIGRMLGAAVVMAVLTAGCVLCTTALATHAFHLALPQLRSVVFFAMVAMGQIAVFVVRTRDGVVGVAPSMVLVAAALAATAAALGMTALGLLTAELPLVVIVAVLGLLLVSGSLLAFLKIPIFSMTRIAGAGLSGR
ncbi:MAG TPA: HAD-IC family P-type ATPase [Candidatus Baltobacteraceae bacterium]|nr:HAD-IC family P-type ATPase [Candidatus Baltobacteraceae bacterium]